MQTKHIYVYHVHFRDDEDAKWLSWVEKQFAEIAGEDQEIDLDEFKGALKVKKVNTCIVQLHLVITSYLHIMFYISFSILVVLC